MAVKIVPTSLYDWMFRNLDDSDLRTIIEYGCSAGIPGMIFYTETTSLYAVYSDSVWSQIKQYAEEAYLTVGEVIDQICPDPIAHHQFANSMVWFAAERLAHDVLRHRQEVA
jgi:hypothetical protein